MLEIECHNCFLSFSKENFCRSFPMRCCCHRYSMFKIKQGIEDLGRWCSRAGDGTKDQTAVKNSGNWERQGRRGETRILMPTSGSLSLFHCFASGSSTLEFTICMWWCLLHNTFFPRCKFLTEALVSHQAWVVSVLSSWPPSNCRYPGVNPIKPSALHRSNLPVVYCR